MSSTTIIIIIAIFIIGSFILNAISYTKQQALKKRNQMLKRLQQQTDEALSFIPLLLRIDKKYDLIIQLQTLAVNALSKAHSLNPEDRITHRNLNSQKIKLNEYKQLQRQNEVTCWVSSDAELTAIQSQLSHVDKLLDLYRNNEDLTMIKHQDLKQHLKSLQQQLTINTHLYQADTFGEQNNIISYQLYIKRAIQVIKKSTIESIQKTQKIKELSDRLQEVKNTGKASNLINLIKPSDTLNLEVAEKTIWTE